MLFPLVFTRVPTCSHCLNPLGRCASPSSPKSALIDEDVDECSGSRAYPDQQQTNITTTTRKAVNIRRADKRRLCHMFPFIFANLFVSRPWRTHRPAAFWGLQSNFEQTSPKCNADGMGPIICLELFDNILDMEINRCLTYGEAAGYLLVPVPIPNEFEYFKLTGGEILLAHVLGDGARDV